MKTDSLNFHQFSSSIGSGFCCICCFLGFCELLYSRMIFFFNSSARIFFCFAFPSLRICSLLRRTCLVFRISGRPSNRSGGSFIVFSSSFFYFTGGARYDFFEDFVIREICWQHHHDPLLIWFGRIFDSKVPLLFFSNQLQLCNKDILYRQWGSSQQSNFRLSRAKDFFIHNSLQVSLSYYCRGLIRQKELVPH